MSDVRPDQIIDSRYRLISPVGTGGMAEVWCAEDLQLGRNVAVKLLHRRFAADAEFVERFRREASAAGGLQHPNVVQVYDRGEIDGISYIAMEYLDGRPLKRIVQEEGPLEPSRAIDLVGQILRAARFAHRRGVIHRDLKPHNVIVDDEGRAKVTDFGIARAGASDMTQTGSIMGTAQYLSPEQAQGHAVSAASDLYSIGVILYELLTGRLPFEADSAVTIALKHIQESPAPPSAINPGVSPGLDAVVLRALEKDPARRFADADEFLEALDAARSTSPAEAAAVYAGTMDATQMLPPTTYDEVAYRPAQPLPPLPERDGSRWWLGLLAVLMVAALVIGAVLLFGGEKVTVPSVVNAPVAEAEIALRRQGFSTDVVRKASDEPRDVVIGQDPAGGTDVDKGATVTLTVSDGPGNATIPNLSGKGRRAARAQLVELGFTVQEREQPDDEVGENRVIATIPGEGESLEKGSPVTLVVSTGRERVAVPEVVGDDREDARGTLEGAGLTVKVAERETDDQDPGTVLEQTPPAGTSVRKGTEVTIVVATEVRQVDVPSVVGRPVDQAVEELSGEGFTVRQVVQQVDNPDEDGVVLSQDPAEGRVDRGSRVTLTVGKFDPDLNPDPTETTPTTTTP